MTASVALIGGASPAFASLGESSTTARPTELSTYGQTIRLFASVQDFSTSCILFDDCDTPTGRMDFYDNTDPTS